jgi:AbrB family looped-hinge helix DNA binding protein
MTVVHMSEKGQIVVPKDIRDRRGYANGSAFSIVETHDGALFLKPVRAKPKLDLVDHLLRLKGIEIPERKHLCPPRV